MAKDIEELELEELQQRLEQLRALQERCDQGRLDISDQPLLLELISNLIEEAERNGHQLVIPEPDQTAAEPAEGGGAESSAPMPTSKIPQH